MQSSLLDADDVEPTALDRRDGSVAGVGAPIRFARALSARGWSTAGNLDRHWPLERAEAVTPPWDVDLVERPGVANL